MLRQFWKRFWMPPRAHGDVRHERRVSYVELFYDLVFVVVVARAAHALAHHVTWGGVGVFAVTFAMVWVLWLNGTLYYELHGREDGRTRTFVFLEMTLLALLAVFTEDAGGKYGREFAIVYSLLLAVVTMFLWRVQSFDAPEYLAQARRYVALMVASLAIVGASVFAPDGWRVWMWAAFAIMWLAATLATFMRPRPADQVANVPTESVVERFDLFTILVLGEVVSGVVIGLSGSQSATTGMVAAVFGMLLAFAFWWLYFDFVSHHIPVNESRLFGTWIAWHLPASAAIVAAGAAVVSLVEHAEESHTPTPTAWLLAGATSIFLVSLVGVSQTLPHYRAENHGFPAVVATLIVASVAVLVVGALRPVAWLFSLLLVIIASVGWVVGAVRSVAHGTAPSPEGL
jgi:low temperature requirement protein LtrA